MGGRGRSGPLAPEQLARPQRDLQFEATAGIPELLAEKGRRRPGGGSLDHVHAAGQLQLRRRLRQTRDDEVVTPYTSAFLAGSAVTDMSMSAMATGS